MLVAKVYRAAKRNTGLPIIFSTLVQDEVRDIVMTANGLFLDFFDAFVGPLERELATRSTHRAGRAHGMADLAAYATRIDATNFSLAHDDGQSAKGLAEADVILVGVSRSGKTPTSLYLAMQYGVKAANYPLIPEDFERKRLPSALLPHVAKCFGLTIDPERLAQIRNERRPGSKYASIESCRHEVREAELLRALEHERIVRYVAHGTTPDGESYLAMEWLGGETLREQGISKAGNRHIRARAIETAWFWLRYQPTSALSRWYFERFADGGARRRRIGIVALARRLVKGAPGQTLLDSLTNRELQVLQGLALGQTNREIAAAYGISIKTVNTYRDRLLKKLNLRNNTELSFRLRV